MSTHNPDPFTDLQILSRFETVQPKLISCLFDELITKPEMDLLQKARALKSAFNRLQTARAAHKTARKIYQQSRIWRSDADPEEQHWELKTREALEQATCDLKAAEAELRRLKLVKLQ